MEDLALRFTETHISRLTRRALNQCVRELFLAQSSDWPFMISNGTSTEYAVRRIKDHIARFHHLAASLAQNAVNEENLSALEQMDNLFPRIDFGLFREDTFFRSLMPDK